MRQACFSQGTHLARLLSKTGIFRVGKVACTTALHEVIYADEFICFGGLLCKTGIFRVGKVACTTALHEVIYADEFICFGGWLEMRMCKYSFGLRVHAFNGVNHQ